MSNSNSYNKGIVQIYKNFTAAEGLYPSNLGPLWETALDIQPVVIEEVSQVNAMLGSMPSCYKQLVGNFQYTTDMVNDFKRWSSQGVVYAGSDGSIKHNMGAHGFGFTSGMKVTNIWGGAAETSGNAAEITPLRSEHAGSIAIIILLHILQTVTKVKLQVEIWVDNAEVIRRVTATNVSAVALDYDLFMTTRLWLQKIQYTLKWSKVDSYNDKKLRVDPT